MRKANLPNAKRRAGHCIGCGVTFEKMHLMIRHRRNDRCGGRFLPYGERELRMAAKYHWQKWMILLEGDVITDEDKYHYHQWKDMTYRANLLRQRRLR